MRNFKRFLAMALTMLMVASSFAMVAGASAFDDVVEYVEEIDTLAALGVIKGTTDTTYDPDDDVTRWQMALLISKLMTGKVETAVWESPSNYTDFTDIEANHYFGSIAYVANNGVVRGTTDTTFDPEANIMYQDALTMAARALGYTITAAEYPYKAIDIAYKANLVDGIAITDYTETLTRGETAKLLYNLLLAENADGESFGETAFNLKTKNVVIVAAHEANGSRYVSFDGATTAGDIIQYKGNTVAFAELYENGLYNRNAVYYINEKEFGIEGDCEQYIGTSYKVTTLDDFQTILTAEMNGRDILDGSAFVYNESGLYFTINGTIYRSADVSKGFTTLKNNQGHNRFNQSELLIWSANVDGIGGSKITATTGVTGSATPNLSTDINGNYYDAQGNIVIYYVPGAIATYGSNYLVKLDDNVYRAAAEADWEKVATVSTAAGSFKAYNVAGDTRIWWNEIVNNNALLDALAFDDDNDGDYERIITQFYRFGKYTLDASGNACINGTSIGAKPSAIKFLNADGSAGTAPASGSYIMYAYNKPATTMTIKETLTVETGLLTSYDQAAKTVVIGGVTYGLGVSNMPGADFITADQDKYALNKLYVYDNMPSHVNPNIGDPATMIGQHIYFAVYNGKIVALYNSASASTPVVFDAVTGITTAGYVTAKVYTPAGASIITIATINGYSYYQFYYPTLNNINDLLVKGEVYTATVDASGNYHLKTATEAISNTYYNKGNADTTLTFGNGFSGANADLYTKNGGAFAAFNTSTSTVFAWVVNGMFYVQTGLPTNGTTLTINADAKMSVIKNSSNVASFVYITDGSASGMFSAVDFRQNYVNNTNTTIIYIDKDATQVITDQITGGALLGNSYAIMNAVDVINGGLITVYNTGYNAQFEYGAFYTVQNGWLGQKVDLLAADSPIKVGTLNDIDRANYTAQFVNAAGETINLDYTTASAYYLKSGNIYSKYDAYALHSIATADGSVSTDPTNKVPYDYAAKASGLAKVEGQKVYYYAGIDSDLGANNYGKVLFIASPDLAAAATYTFAIDKTAKTITVTDAPRGSYVVINNNVNNPKDLDATTDVSEAFADDFAAGDIVYAYNVANELLATYVITEADLA